MQDKMSRRRRRRRREWILSLIEKGRYGGWYLWKHATCSYLLGTNLCFILQQHTHTHTHTPNNKFFKRYNPHLDTCHWMNSSFTRLLDTCPIEDFYASTCDLAWYGMIGVLYLVLVFFFLVFLLLLRPSLSQPFVPRTCPDESTLDTIVIRPDPVKWLGHGSWEQKHTLIWFFDIKYYINIYMLV
jgi:hypothetical protein